MSGCLTLPLSRLGERPKPDYDGGPITAGRPLRRFNPTAEIAPPVLSDDRVVSLLLLVAVDLEK